MIRSTRIFAIPLILYASSPALAIDKNTVDSVVTIDQGEEGFVLFGKRVRRHLKPGTHTKLPIVERVAVIVTDAYRYETLDINHPLKDGGSCNVIADLVYNIGDARKAYEWRRARGLDMSQQTSYWSSPRTDYHEPNAVGNASLQHLAETLTPRQLICGAVSGWDGGEMIGRINADGTKIVSIGASSFCEPIVQLQCHLTPPVRKSFNPAPQIQR